MRSSRPDLRDAGRLHPWDEAFYVIAGEVTFGVGDIESVAIAGTLVQVPAGTTHWFRIGEPQSTG